MDGVDDRAWAYRVPATTSRGAIQQGMASGFEGSADRFCRRLVGCRIADEDVTHSAPKDHVGPLLRTSCRSWSRPPEASTVSSPSVGEFEWPPLGPFASRQPDGGRRWWARPARRQQLEDARRDRDRVGACADHQRCLPGVVSGRRRQLRGRPAGLSAPGRGRAGVRPRRSSVSRPERRRPGPPVALPVARCRIPDRRDRHEAHQPPEWQRPALVRRARGGRDGQRTPGAT